MTPDLTQARLHCEAAFPNEGVCAYLRSDSGWHFVALENVSDASRTSFVIDPRAWMKLERANQPVCLVHSHVDAPAALSQWDLDSFTVDGKPLLPSLTIAVLEVRDAKTVSERCWQFRNGAWEPITPCL
ncbi:MAG: Mov34/MPN/PAD-1 family protein [Archangium sp.]|nr:Mov34/MPN/PAD-1 family protein [Archangium sp.]